MNEVVIKKKEPIDYSKLSPFVKKEFVKEKEIDFSDTESILGRIVEDYNISESKAVNGLVFCRRVRLGDSLTEAYSVSFGESISKDSAYTFWEQRWVKDMYLSNFNPDDENRYESERNQIVEFLMQVINDRNEETKVRLDATAKIQKYITGDKKEKEDKEVEVSKMDKLVNEISGLVSSGKTIGYGGEIIEVKAIE